MKTIILFLLLTQHFTAFSISFPVEKIIIEKHIQTNIRVTAELITFRPCEPNGVSATVRVNVYTSNDLLPNTWFLAASQVVEIPCGTIHKMTRAEFDKYARPEKTDKVALVVDYLNQNDKDESIFSKLADEIEKTLKHLDKK